MLKSEILKECIPHQKDSRLGRELRTRIEQCIWVIKSLELRERAGLETYWGTLTTKGLLEEAGPARDSRADKRWEDVR